VGYRFRTAQAVAVSSASRWMEMLARPGNTVPRYSRTGIFKRRQLSTMDRTAATFGPAFGLPTWIQFFRQKMIVHAPPRLDIWTPSMENQLHGDRRPSRTANRCPLASQGLAIPAGHSPHRRVNIQASASLFVTAYHRSTNRAGSQAVGACIEKSCGRVERPKKGQYKAKAQAKPQRKSASRSRRRRVREASRTSMSSRRWRMSVGKQMWTGRQVPLNLRATEFSSWGFAAM
jgi:hypothetical protein